MKSITLHTAELDNGGTRREAGVSVDVGKGADQIARSRAKALVVNGSAAKAVSAK